MKKIGVTGSFIGCFKSLIISNDNHSHVYNFSLHESSSDVLKHNDIGKLWFSDFVLSAPFDVFLNILIYIYVT